MTPKAFLTVYVHEHVKRDQAENLNATTCIVENCKPLQSKAN